MLELYISNCHRSLWERGKVSGPSESLWSFISITTRHFRCTYKLTLIRNLSIYFKDIRLCKIYIVVAAIYLENLLDLIYELLVFICAEELKGIISLPAANYSDCKHSFLRKTDGSRWRRSFFV